MAVAVAASASLLLYLLIPGALEEMLAGEMDGAPLDDALGYVLAMLVFIPLAMTAVTLLASDRVNRYASVIAGLLLWARRHLRGGRGPPAGRRVQRARPN